MEVKIKPHRDYNKGVGKDSIVSWDLIVNHKNPQVLEIIKDVIQEIT